jgi:hypothetical protein
MRHSGPIAAVLAGKRLCRETLVSGDRHDSVFRPVSANGLEHLLALHAGEPRRPAIHDDRTRDKSKGDER